MSEADAWIAATALAFAVPLVTHNPDDFKNVPGLTVITEK
jgi:predicted nucleic acid-binding protein